MIDDTKEYIACSAIHYDNGIKYPFMGAYGIKSGFVLCGFRHPYICSVLPTNVFFESDKEHPEVHKTTQGFMTSYGRFVDRKEAKGIAISCGQCKAEEVRSSDLYSEDMFKYQRYYAD